MGLGAPRKYINVLDLRSVLMDPDGPSSPTILTTPHGLDVPLAMGRKYCYLKAGVLETFLGPNMLLMPARTVKLVDRTYESQ